MKSKQFALLAGLPRSGNTLLAALLNQHPDVYCSPLSPVASLLETVEYQLLRHPFFLKNPNPTAFQSVMKGLPLNYYKHIEESYVIDRFKFWVTPENLRRARLYMSDNVKIVFTVRPVLECLASFIRLTQTSDWLDQGILDSGFVSDPSWTPVETYCEYLMSPGNLLANGLESLHYAKTISSENLMFVNYNDLVNSPQEVLLSVSKFLNISTDFSYNLFNIQKLEKDNELATGEPLNLHEVRSTIEKRSEPIDYYLPETIIKKYWGV